MNGIYSKKRMEQETDYESHSRKIFSGQNSEDSYSLKTPSTEIVVYEKITKDQSEKSSYPRPQNSYDSITDTSSYTSDKSFYPRTTTELNKNPEHYILNVKKIIINQNDNRMENFNNMKSEHSFRRNFPLVTPRRHTLIRDDDNLIKRPEAKISKAQSLSRQKETTRDFERIQIPLTPDPYSHPARNKRYSLINPGLDDQADAISLDDYNTPQYRHKDSSRKVRDNVDVWPVTIKSIAQPVITPRKTSLNLNVMRTLRGFDRHQRTLSQDGHNANRSQNVLLQHNIKRECEAIENHRPRSNTSSTGHDSNSTVRNEYQIKTRPRPPGDNKQKRRCRSVHFSTDVSVAEVFDEYPFIISQTILKDYP